MNENGRRRWIHERKIIRLLNIRGERKKYNNNVLSFYHVSSRFIFFYSYRACFFVLLTCYVHVNRKHFVKTKENKRRINETEESGKKVSLLLKARGIKADGNGGETGWLMAKMMTIRYIMHIRH